MGGVPLFVTYLHFNRQPHSPSIVNTTLLLRLGTCPAGLGSNRAALVLFIGVTQ